MLAFSNFNLNKLETEKQEREQENIRKNFSYLLKNLSTPMNTFTKQIRDITRFIPFLTIVLFFLSFVGNFTYYDRYGISIIEFFESGDYIGIFFDDLIYLAMYLSFILLFNQFVQRKSGTGLNALSNQIDNLQNKLEEIKKSEIKEIKESAESILQDILDVIVKLKKQGKIILNILYYLFLALFIIHTISYITTGSSVFIYFLQAATSIIVLWQINKCLKYIKSVGYDENTQKYIALDMKKLDKVSDPISYLIYFNIILSSIIAYNRGFKDHMSFGRSDRVEYIMHLNDTTITTNDSLKYLGSSKNYFYLYEKTNDKSIVLNRGEIKELEIIRRPKSKNKDNIPKDSTSISSEILKD